jgi:hypothetical protein
MTASQHFFRVSSLPHAEQVREFPKPPFNNLTAKVKN